MTGGAAVERTSRGDAAVARGPEGASDGLEGGAAHRQAALQEGGRRAQARTMRGAERSTARGRRGQARARAGGRLPGGARPRAGGRAAVHILLRAAKPLLRLFRRRTKPPEQHRRKMMDVSPVSVGGRRGRTGTQPPLPRTLCMILFLHPLGGRPVRSMSRGNHGAGRRSSPSVSPYDVQMNGSSVSVRRRRGQPVIPAAGVSCYGWSPGHYNRDHVAMSASLASPRVGWRDCCLLFGVEQCFCCRICSAAHFASSCAFSLAALPAAEASMLSSGPVSTSNSLCSDDARRHDIGMENCPSKVLKALSENWGADNVSEKYQPVNWFV